MKAIIATAPQVGRILRPLCHMFGPEAPAGLRLPKRVRKRWALPTLRLSEADEAKLARMTARFPDTPPARAAKRALRRMFAGKPVDVRRLFGGGGGLFPPSAAGRALPTAGDRVWRAVAAAAAGAQRQVEEEKKRADSGLRRNDEVEGVPRGGRKDSPCPPWVSL
jgi:hypothetical protein